MHSLQCGSTVFLYQVLERRPEQDTSIVCVGLCNNFMALNISPVCCYGSKSKEIIVGQSCSLDGRIMKYVYNFVGETSWRGVGRTVLKSVLRKIGCEKDCSHSSIQYCYVQWWGLILVMLEVSGTTTTELVTFNR
jgi:hypothetical protein